VPAGAVAAGKLAQVAAAGAELVEVDGDFGAAFEAAEALASERGYVIVNSTNPDRIEGQTSAAAEIVEQLGGVPDVLCLPYGGGGGGRGDRTRRRAGRRARRLRAHRPRAQGSRCDREARRVIRVKAPATAANLGPGFDAVGVAFELWNELEVGSANGGTPEGT